MALELSLVVWDSQLGSEGALRDPCSAQASPAPILPRSSHSFTVLSQSQKLLWAFPMTLHLPPTTATSVCSALTLQHGVKVGETLLQINLHWISRGMTSLLLEPPWAGTSLWEWPWRCALDESQPHTAFGSLLVGWGRALEW